ncbi:MAG: hypothetical protein HT580_03400 [Dechloromonas sp.]|nr:MAG: hypothetical protein HT580_03400 [Dechloromonas sp.]
MQRVVYCLNLDTGRFEYISSAAAALFGLDADVVRDAGMELVSQHMLPGISTRSWHTSRKSRQPAPGSACR